MCRSRPRNLVQTKGTTHEIQEVQREARVSSRSRQRPRSVRRWRNKASRRCSLFIRHPSLVGAPGLDWQITPRTGRHAERIVAWDRMQHMARLDGSINKDRNFTLDAKEVGGAGRTATVHGYAGGHLYQHHDHRLREQVRRSWLTSQPPLAEPAAAAADAKLANGRCFRRLDMDRSRRRVAPGFNGTGRAGREHAGPRPCGRSPVDSDDPCHRRLNIAALPSDVKICPREDLMKRMSLSFGWNGSIYPPSEAGQSARCDMEK